MVLRYLIEKEFKQIRRNRIFVVLILWFPIVTLVILPWAVNFEVRNVRVGFLDDSNGIYSRRLVEKIKASDSFIPIVTLRSYQHGLQLIDEQALDVVIHIPSSFDSDLLLGRNPQLFLAALAVNPTQALLASNYISLITAQFSQELRLEHPALAGGPAPLAIATNYRYNPSLDFKTNMLPAFIVILITLVCGLLPALNIVQEKENGTILQLNVTPVTRLQFVLSKLIPYWIIGTIILISGVTIVVLVYNLWPRAAFHSIFLLSITFIICISGFGIIVSNHSNTLRQAMLVMLFFILIFLLMSGLFSPVDTMPAWAQVLAYANPLTHYIEALRLLYLKGSALREIAPQFIVLAAFALGINAVAILSYRKSR